MLNTLCTTRRCDTRPSRPSDTFGCPWLLDPASYFLHIPPHSSLFLNRNPKLLFFFCESSLLRILPQILGSLPEVIRSCCHHHHHHHHHTRSSRGRFEWSARFHRPSRRVAGPGKRHSARGTPRAQPRDVRSAGRDTWNLTGEALGGPRKRSWRRCSRARSGSRSAIRGAHSGALDRPEPSDPAARAPICTSAPYSAADASGSSCAAGARLR